MTDYPNIERAVRSLGLPDGTAIFSHHTDEKPPRSDIVSLIRFGRSFDPSFKLVKKVMTADRQFCLIFTADSAEAMRRLGDRLYGTEEERRKASMDASEKRRHQRMVKRWEAQKSSCPEDVGQLSGSPKDEPQQ